MPYYERMTAKIKNVIKTNVYPPKFNKKRWRLIKQVNCYAYALDLPVRDRKMEIFIPGCISNPDVIPAIFNSNELITRLKKDLDFLGLSYREDNGKLKKGEWRIAFYYFPSFLDMPIGFHFVRQDEDGCWSQKKNWKANISKEKEKSDSPPDLSEYDGKLRGVLILSKK